MRNAALILLLGSLFLPAAETPRPSPELTIERVGAPPLHLKDFRGKIVALAFTHTTCSHCQDLTRILTAIQKDYAGRNVQVLECAFNLNAQITLPPFMLSLQPNFPVGFTTDAAVKYYLSWKDSRDGDLYVPYMIFIDSTGTIQGDYNGRDGFFMEMDKRIRGVLDGMVSAPAKTVPKKK